MDLTERLRAWTYRRQRLGSPARTLPEALRSVVAVYATHPTAPLALWARAASFGIAAYRRFDRQRTALRIPGMRGTIFLVPREDAAAVFTAVRPVSARILRTLRRHGFTTEDYERHARRILAAAARPVRGEDLDVGIAGQPLGSILRCLRYEGRLLALAGDSLFSSPHRYVAADPGELDAGDPGEALARLAGRYLRAYGPARVEDFAWWAGVTPKAAGAAVAAHRTEDVGGGLLLPVRDRAAFGRIRPVRGTVHLLPKWDAYTMGHAPDGRERFVHPDVQQAVYTPKGRVGFPGDGNPVVLVDGHVAGLWSFTRKEGAAVHPFDTFGPTVRREVDRKLGEVAALLAADSTASAS